MNKSTDTPATPPAAGRPAAIRRVGSPAAYIASALTLACVLFLPVVLNNAKWLGLGLSLRSGQRVHVWPRPEESVLLLLSALLLPVAAWFAIRRASRGRRFAQQAWRVLQPLALLPLAALPSCAQGLLPVGFSASVLFYGPVVCATWVLLRVSDIDRTGVNLRPVALWAVPVTTVGCAILFFLTGMYFTQSVGFHSGRRSTLRHPGAKASTWTGTWTCATTCPASRRNGGSTRISAARLAVTTGIHGTRSDCRCCLLPSSAAERRCATLSWGAIAGLGCGGSLLACPLPRCRQAVFAACHLADRLQCPLGRVLFPGAAGSPGCNLLLCGHSPAFSPSTGGRGRR